VIAVTDAFQAMDHFYWYVDLAAMIELQLINITGLCRHG
jgi:hypothetical protein